MKRLLGLSTLLTLIALAVPAPAQDKKPARTARDGLKQLNDFIGRWNGSGQTAKAKPELWSETIAWSWRFKGDDGWMEMTVTDGRFFKKAELRYLPDRQRYQLTAIDRSDKKLVFEGEYKDGYLRLERADAEKKETQRVSMNTAAEGVRFILLFERRPEGRTLY